MGKWPLSGTARELWMKHPTQGADYLRTSCDFPEVVYNSIAEHHEWYNGTGYPSGKSGKNIHIYARIIKLVDCYDAMVSKRPGRQVQAPSEAIEYLMAGNGTEFDPELVNLFARKLWVYPKGCEVELSDGRRGIVARNFEDFPLRPLVKLLHTGELLNLRDDPDARRLTVGKMIVK
jgi:HD-GYP domain-containing protein (c-di-GMP phosphodiesterase class II)